MAKFVSAYETRTGRKVRVPKHFLDNPALCKGLSRTPRQKAGDHHKAAKAAAKKPTTEAPATGGKKEDD